MKDLTVVANNSNVVPLYPKGMPKATAERLNKVFGDKRIEEVVVTNFLNGQRSNLKEERDFLHNTINNTIAGLYSMSAHQKHEAFVGLGNAMKMVFDLYIAEKIKGKV